MSTTLTVRAHPRLMISAFVTTYAPTLASCPSPDWLVELLCNVDTAPVHRDEHVRLAVRDMMRHGGYKPTGRGKPASEYLVAALAKERLGSINLAVDGCNVVSLHSGLPISVVDLDKAAAPLWVGCAEEDARYVFNSSGQEIRIAGLACLHDAAGPCANGVKDSQRTKTSDSTQRTLSVIWGVRGFEAQVDAATAWYRQLLVRAGAATTDCAIVYES